MIFSCSDDEENGSEVNNTLEINDERYQVEDATISDGVSNEDVLVGCDDSAESVSCVAL